MAATAETRRLRKAGILPPASRDTPFGFMDPDDPEFERVVRQYAETTGQDPDQLLDEELRARTGRSLDEIRAEAEQEGARRGARSARASGARTARAPSAGGRRRSGRGGRWPSWATPTIQPPRRLSAGDGSGLLLGLVLYAIALNALRYGPGGVGAWIRAKFINQTSTPARAGDDGSVEA